MIKKNNNYEDLFCTFIIYNNLVLIFNNIYYLLYYFFDFDKMIDKLTLIKMTFDKLFQLKFQNDLDKRFCFSVVRIYYIN